MRPLRDRLPSGYRRAKRRTVHGSRRAFSVNVRFSPTVIAQVRRATRKSGRSQNSEINALLAKALGIRGLA